MDNEGQLIRYIKYFSVLVSGIFVHRGIASGGGGRFTKLLYVEATIESSYVDNMPPKYSLDIVDQRTIGEIFDFNLFNN